MKSISGFFGLRLLIIHAIASLASADAFNYTAQSRSVFAKVGSGAGGGSLTINASDFSDFDRTAHLQIDPPAPTGFATQHQLSILAPDAISVSGDFSGQYPQLVGTGYSQGHSVTAVTFTITQDTGVYLSATAQYTGNSDRSILKSNVRLLGPGTFLNWTTPAGGLNPSTFSQSQALLLAPGSYDLIVDFDSDLWSSSSAYSTPSFNVVLAVPEPTSLSLLPLVLLLKRNARRLSN